MKNNLTHVLRECMVHRMEKGMVASYIASKIRKEAEVIPKNALISFCLLVINTHSKYLESIPAILLNLFGNDLREKCTGIFLDICKTKP